MTKWVYSFGKEKNDGDSSMRNLLGGKGCNLAEMAGLGLPVPPGFTITTDVCTHYYDNDQSYPDELTAQVEDALALKLDPNDLDPRLVHPFAIGLLAKNYQYGLSISENSQTQVVFSLRYP